LYANATGFPATDLPYLEETNTESNFRVNGIKLCASDLNFLTGMQLQIGKANDTTQRYTNVLTLGALGVVDPCPNKTLFGIATDNSITQLQLYYNETKGVSRIEVETSLNQNTSAGVADPTDKIQTFNFNSTMQLLGLWGVESTNIT